MDSACCACSKDLKECFVGNERASIRHIGTLIDRPNSVWITFLARGGETFGVDWRGVREDNSSPDCESFKPALRADDAAETAKIMC